MHKRMFKLCILILLPPYIPPLETFFREVSFTEYEISPLFLLCKSFLQPGVFLCKPVWELQDYSKKHTKMLSQLEFMRSDLFVYLFTIFHAHSTRSLTIILLITMSPSVLNMFPFILPLQDAIHEAFWEEPKPTCWQ
jgi:hypothetical protein